jgi:hypothetical protein
LFEPGIRKIAGGVSSSTSAASDWTTYGAPLAERSRGSKEPLARVLGEIGAHSHYPIIRIELTWAVVGSAKKAC